MPLRRQLFAFLNIVKTMGWRGWKDYIRLILWKIGIGTTITMHYPNTTRENRVSFGIVWRLLEAGRWENDELDCLMKLVKRGNLVIDVGAWEGHYTLLFSQLVGPEGRVIAFEPDPIAAKKLRFNLSNNLASNVVVEEACVGDREGRVTLATSQLGDSTTSMMRYQTVDASKVHRITVDCFTLDKYCAAKGLIPSGVKIDAEGAEADILDGMRRTVEAHRPWVVLEFHGQYMDDNARSNNWMRVTKAARSVTFLEGNSDLLEYGSALAREGSSDGVWATFKLPDCLHFSVLIKY